MTPVHGQRLGRYVVLRRLGVGAMGTVYLGYDPELDRRVALKLLRSGKNKRRALLREAQAMAKLTHPNVVGVYDAGEHDGTVYVAMELVEGGTLRDWMRQRDRGWREVVETFLRAGRGLAAAHECGLIHRDFKPENVMLSVDGDVRVSDFGLARPESSMSASGSSDEIDLYSGSLLTEVTSGKIEGTPAYMAPEQAAGGEQTPAVDQFAFCVSLWEGVCGRRPFAGETPVELLASASGGRVQAPPRAARMPRWLRRVLERGLDPNPSRRWPSMTVLLSELRRGRRRWRRQVGALATTAAALPLLLSAAESHRSTRDHAEQVAACQAEGAAIDAVYDDEARQRLRRGLLATHVGFAVQDVEILLPWLDAYRDAWQRGRTEACIEGRVRKTWDAETSDRSMWCFEDRRLQLQATVDQIASADAQGARRAVRLASYLDPVDSCLDPEVLRRLPAPPRELRDRVRVLRKELSRSDRLRHGGHATEALAVARKARAEAEALGWPPLIASAQFVEGRCSYENGQAAEAELTLTAAYFSAQAAGSNEVAFRAARSLVLSLNRMGRFHEAEVWSRHADQVSAELADPGGLDAAEGHYLRMVVHHGLGQYESAAREGELAWKARTALLGEMHPLSVAVLTGLGRVHLASGRPESALAKFERAYQVWRAAVGPGHPRVAELALLRGKSLLALGKPRVALPQLEEALAVHEALYPASHSGLALNLDALGHAYAALGRLDEADEAHARAARVRTDASRPVGDRAIVGP